MPRARVTGSRKMRKCQAQSFPPFPMVQWRESKCTRQWPRKRPSSRAKSSVQMTYNRVSNYLLAINIRLSNMFYNYLFQIKLDLLISNKLDLLISNKIRFKLDFPPVTTAQSLFFYDTPIQNTFNSLI